VAAGPIHEDGANEMNSLESLERAYSGAVHDTLRAAGYPHQVLPTDIAPLARHQKVAGPVFTVGGRLAPGKSEHEILLGWTGLLSKAPKGSVVICQPNDSSLAHFGELSAETMKSRGVRGYIVDGGCRDTGFIEELGFPVFCRYFTPRDIVGSWAIDTIGEPVVIGGVSIRSGDYVIADRDGVVIVPASFIDEVANRVVLVMATENLVRNAIREGVDPQEAYLRYGKF
jgi:4-hydroxy-4-methyl-2-oxoglutarate aldolase